MDLATEGAVSAQRNRSAGKYFQRDLSKMGKERVLRAQGGDQVIFLWLAQIEYIAVIWEPRSWGRCDKQDIRVH